MAQIIKEYPPNIAKITAVFPKLPDTVCFAYGDKIYFPMGETMAEDLLIHEGVHARQQGDKVEEWWDRYLTDSEFRQSQEVEAYAVQYNFIKQSRPEKIAKRYLEMFAHHLSMVYKLDINFHKAYAMIRLKARSIVV